MSSKTIDGIDSNSITSPLKIGTVNATDTTASTNKTTGSLTSAGGLGVAGTINANSLNVNNSSAQSAGTDIVLSPFTGSNAVVIHNSDGSVDLNAAVYNSNSLTGNTLNVRGSIGSDGTATLAAVIFYATSNMPQGNLGYYSENPYTLQFLGPFAAQNATFQINRVGSILTISSSDEEISAAATSSNVITGTLPNTDTIPLQTFSKPIIVKNNSAYAFGRMEITNGGAINIYADAGSTAFTNAGNCGWKGFSVTYCVSD